MAREETIITKLSEDMISFYRNPKSPTTQQAILAQAELVRSTYDKWYTEVAKIGVTVDELKSLPANSIILTPSTGSDVFQVVIDDIPGKVLTSNYPDIPTFEVASGGGGGTWGSIIGTLTDQLDLQAELDTKEDLSNKGIASGYASLDGTVKVPISQLPSSTESSSGVAEIATTAEVTTGTDDTRIVTPLKLAQALTGVTVADASSTVKGILKLTNELGGTADLPTLSNSAVINKVLTGYVSGTGTITAADSLLIAIEKLNGNLEQAITQIGYIQTGNNLYNYYNFR